jgi:hypothetical protein
MDGVNIFQYSHKSLKLPMGVAVDQKGHVYVCGFHSTSNIDPSNNQLEQYKTGNHKNMYLD